MIKKKKKKTKKKNIQNECRSHKSIIQGQIELKIDLFSRIILSMLI